jgi:hypothetical protein
MVSGSLHQHEYSKRVDNVVGSAPPLLVSPVTLSCPSEALPTEAKSRSAFLLGKAVRYVADKYEPSMRYCGGSGGVSALWGFSATLAAKDLWEWWSWRGDRTRHVGDTEQTPKRRRRRRLMRQLGTLHAFYDVVSAAIFVAQEFTELGTSNVSRASHLQGFAVGVGSALVWWGAKSGVKGVISAR